MNLRLLRPVIAALALVTVAPAVMANFAFAISPPRFELAARPGERLRQTIEITNASPSASTLLVRTADWELRPDESVVFHDTLQPGSCRAWVAIERRELVVPSRLPYRFRFEVAPPAGQAPVECRFAIMMEGKDASLAGATGAVPVGARVGVIVYVAVGEVKPQLAVMGARVEMRNGLPVAVLDVSNSGTAHGRLDGFLTASDARGQAFEVTAANSPILPGETRAIALSLSRRDGSSAPAQAEFPLVIKGKLEWGKGQSTDLDQRFSR